MCLAELVRDEFPDLQAFFLRAGRRMQKSSPSKISKESSFWYGLVHSWGDPTVDKSWVFLQLLVEQQKDRSKPWMMFTDEKMLSLSQIFWDPVAWRG